MNSNNIYYIWLSCAIGGSYEVYRELVDALGSVYDIYRADSETYERLSHRVRRRIDALNDKSIDTAVRISDYCRSSGIALITYEDRSYPSLLRDIEKPPILLYVRGNMPAFERDLHVAVVGTRKMTDYGKCVAYNMGYSLARNGAVVVSGMALGNDSVAMCAALDAGATCIGVLGCGVDIAYPPEHAGFLDNILAHGGALISEYAPGTIPKPEYFVERNRIISGLSRATLIIEGDQKSGAMHTARFTSKYGRKLFAIPGKLGDKASEGTLALISEGATLTLDANDILKEYAFLYRGRIDLMTYPDTDSDEIDRRLYARGVKTARRHEEKSARASAPDPEKTEKKKRIGIRDILSGALNKETPKPASDPESEKKAAALPPDVRTVYDKLPKGTIFFIDDVEKYGITAQQFMYASTMLEIYGLLTSYPGARYCVK